MERLVPVAVIGEAHGHAGKVKLTPLDGVVQQIVIPANVYIVDEKGKASLKRIVELKKYYRGKYLAKFEEFKHREQVESLKSFILAVGF